MKYSLTFTDEEKISIVKNFQKLTNKSGFKQNGLILEYMKYVVSKLEQRESLENSSFELITPMDVYYNKERIELGLSNE